MEPSNNSRNINIDLIRSLSMIFVVGIHIIIKPFPELPLARNILFRFLNTANCAFFMISGYFNLGTKFASASDIKRFYAKRAVSILLPYFLISALLFIWADIYSTGSLHLKNFPGDFYYAFMGGNSSSYCWFMYYLIGFMLSTPILARAFSAMNDAELEIIFIVSLIWIAFSSYLTAAFGIKFEYKGWVLSSWALAYFSGYYVRRKQGNFNLKILYSVGFTAFIIRIIAVTYFPENWQFGDSDSVLYFIFSISAFVFVLEKVQIRKIFTAKLINALASISFYVYLVHPAVISELIPFISRLMGKIGHASVIFCIYYALTLVFSIIIAAVLHYLILSPIQKKLNKRISEKYSVSEN